MLNVAPLAPQKWNLIPAVYLYGWVDNKFSWVLGRPLWQRASTSILNSTGWPKRLHKKPHDMFWVMDVATTLDMWRPECRFFYFTYCFPNHHLVYHLPSLPLGLSPTVSSLTIPQGAEVSFSPAASCPWTAVCVRSHWAPASQSWSHGWWFPDCSPRPSPLRGEKKRTA